MDHKPLLQERPPTYNLEAGQGDYVRPARPRRHPEHAPAAALPLVRHGDSQPASRVYSIHGRTVTRYPANSIVVVGGCLVCRVGVLGDCFTFLGIFLAIILFPFGFIYCFALRKRRRPNCGATVT